MDVIILIYSHRKTTVSIPVPVDTRCNDVTCDLLKYQAFVFIFDFMIDYSNTEFDAEYAHCPLRR